MSCEIIIRHANSDDIKLRMELVRSGFSAYFWDAFLFFFFQELTLECCVLAAAILFIFCGISASACLLLVPAAAMVVAVLVAGTHQMLAHKHAQSVRNEVFGLVAEVKGGLMMAPNSSAVPIRLLLDLDKDYAYSQVVGTVSVSEFWGPENKLWLHALAVHPEWRGRGVGRSLGAGARRIAASRGAGGVEAAVSALQPAARAALVAVNWEFRGAYERPLCGAALTLPLWRLATDLPLA